MDLANRSSPSLVRLDENVPLYSIRRQGDVQNKLFLFFLPVAAAKESGNHYFMRSSNRSIHGFCFCFRKHFPLTVLLCGPKEKFWKKVERGNAY